tara:strand:- start:261 stop:596 length:336 start_codon:yes stop_codon:yes gene_type:complete
MKELFREFDFTKVGYYQSIIESQGIETFVKNRDVSGLAGEASIMPDLWPTLCVIKEEDYDRAMQIIRDSVSANAERADIEVDCPACAEKNPGNFDLCWSCGEVMSAAAVQG